MMEGVPVVFRLGADTLARLFTDAANLAAPTAIGVLPADVKAVVIRTDAGEVRLERNLERWLAPDRNNLAVDARLVNDLLAQLSELRPQVIRLAPFPAAAQVATITLEGFGGRPIDSIRVARDEATQAWILENGDSVLRYFPESVRFRLTPVDFGLTSPLQPGAGD